MTQVEQTNKEEQTEAVKSETELDVSKIDHKKEPATPNLIKPIPQMSPDDFVPKPLDPKSEDIVVSVFRGVNFPDSASLVKVHSFLVDAEGGVLQEHAKLADLDSDIFNPKIDLDIRISDSQLKNKKSLLLYSVFVTFEELNTITSDPKDDDTACFLALSVLPLFVEDSNYEPASEYSKVGTSHQELLLSVANARLPIYFAQYSRFSPSQLIDMINE